MPVMMRERGERRYQITEVAVHLCFHRTTLFTRRDETRRRSWRGSTTAIQPRHSSRHPRAVGSSARRRSNPSSGNRVAALKQPARLETRQRTNAPRLILILLPIRAPRIRARPFRPRARRSAATAIYIPVNLQSLQIGWSRTVGIRLDGRCGRERRHGVSGCDPARPPGLRHQRRRGARAARPSRRSRTNRAHSAGDGGGRRGAGRRTRWRLVRAGEITSRRSVRPGTRCSHRTRLARGSSADPRIASEAKAFSSSALRLLPDPCTTRT